MRQDSSETIYEFEQFRVDMTHRRLLDPNSERIALEPKVFDTLLFLVRNAGKVIDKDELKRAVWNGRVVEDNGLVQHISKLRKLLGETPGSNRFIATLPGRGYQFVASVRTTTAEGWAHLATPNTFLEHGERGYRYVRTIRASRDRVFAAWTDPELLRRWYGVADWSLVKCEIDLRIGGHWHMVTQNGSGLRVEQRGVYQVVEIPSRLVYTEMWPQTPYDELLVTTEFAARDGETVFTITVQCADRKTRDQLMASGVNVDAAAGFDRLAQLVEGS